MAMCHVLVICPGGMLQELKDAIVDLLLTVAQDGQES